MVFSVFGVIFVINYTVMRYGYIPLTDSERSNRTRMRVTGFMALLSILFTIYAMTHISVESVMTIFFLSAIGAILIDISGKSSYNKGVILYVCFILIGVLLIIKPAFIYG